MYKHIMIPTDGSELSDKAIDAGIEFAKQVRAYKTQSDHVVAFIPTRQRSCHALRNLLSPKKQSTETVGATFCIACYAYLTRASGQFHRGA